MENSALWLPESAKEVLCVDSGEIEDTETMVLINSTIVDWLNGKVDTGTLTDVLFQFDIDPQIIDDLENDVQVGLK